MYIEVPSQFVSYLRRQRVVRLLGIVAVVVTLAIFTKINNVLVVIGLPLANVLMAILCSGKAIYYRFEPEGISLSTRSNTSGYTGLAGMNRRYWINWSNDVITETTLSRWKQYPALLIRTQKHPTGYVIPVSPTEDLQDVFQFMEAAIKTCE